MKWNGAGELIDKGALAEGMSLKFFNVVIKGYSPRTKLHKVYYPEDRKTYQHNFSKPDEDDFIRRPYWRMELDLIRNWRMAPAQRVCTGFRKFSAGKFMHRARAACLRGFDSLPSF
jgi:hypothetical protein